jgi:hypothetical protein
MRAQKNGKNCFLLLKSGEHFLSLGLFSVD